MIDNLYYEGLCAVKKVFLKHSIIFWLEAGTLIGAMRDGKIIEDDFDFDVSIHEDDSPRILKKMIKLKKDFKELGFDFDGTWRFGLSKKGKHVGCIIPVRNVNGILVKVVKLDIHSLPCLKLCRARASTLGNLAWVEMYKNDMFPVPQYPEDYLGARFGRSWLKKQHWGKHQRPQCFDPQLRQVNKVGIFPARMNPPHVGHFMTLRKLLLDFKIIYVYLYDDGNKFMSLKKRKNIIETIAGDKVKVITEKTGFRFRDYFGNVEMGVVLTGNDDVIDNCKKHKIKCERISRYPDYSGIYIRDSMQCNICKKKKYLFDVTNLLQRRKDLKYTGLLPFPYTHICQQCYFKLLKKEFIKIDF